MYDFITKYQSYLIGWVVGSLLATLFTGSWFTIPAIIVALMLSYKAIKDAT